MKWIAKIFANGLAVLISAWLLPGVYVSDYINALLVALVLIFLNLLIRPLLILLTIPITIFTLGLFLFVINAFIILLASEMVSGFTVDGFWMALLFSIILSIINAIFDSIERRWNRKNNTY